MEKCKTFQQSQEQKPTKFLTTSPPSLSLMPGAQGQGLKTEGYYGKNVEKKKRLRLSIPK